MSKTDERTPDPEGRKLAPSNLNIDEILDNLIDNYVERDGSFGLSQLTTNKHWEEVRKIAKQAIQQELLKARIDELESYPLNWSQNRKDETWQKMILSRIADLQAKLKENNDG